MDTLAGYGLFFGTMLCGYALCRVLRCPAPAFIGPMVCGGLLNYWGLYPQVTLGIPFFLSKVLIGVTVGRRFERGVLATFRDLPVPVLLTSIWMLAASLAAGGILYACVDVSLSTALIGSAAGGVSEMTIFAMALGADVVIVAFIQIFRLIFTLVTMPFIAKLWSLYPVRPPVAPPPPDVDVLPGVDAPLPFTATHYLVLAPIALCCGGLLEWLHVPAGGMLGSMAATALVVLVSGRACRFPQLLNNAAQFCIAAVVAQTMTHDTLLALAELFGPLFLPTLVLLLLCVTLSWILRRITDWNDMTCILATMPAGLIQIVPIAESYGADVLKVSVLHMVRLLSILLLLPWIIRLIVL